uniref:Uncharacterized protein n=1 Tax=Homalodisca liturata TaxID=320908 RepID=A0A1B6J4Q7_9HEMI
MISLQKSKSRSQFFHFWDSVSSQRTQQALSFQKFKCSDTILYKFVLLTFGKYISKSEIMNRRSSRTFSSTVLTKSSEITDGRPERVTSCTFSHPSLKARAHLCILLTLIMLGP